MFLCSQRWRNSIQSAKTRLGTDCGSDHKLLIAKFKLKLKTLGKTTRPFKYDRGSDKQSKGIRADRVPEELWMEIRDIVQEAMMKTVPEMKKCKKAKELSEEALQIAEKRREKTKEKRKDIPIWMQSSKE